MAVTETLTVTEPAEGAGLNLPGLTRDVATLGTGVLLAAVFGTILVFLIPRLVSVKDYGYWRLFMLYTGYAGLLHLGFADGALLRWAGKPMSAFHHEIQPSLKFTFWQQVALTIPVALVCWWGVPRSMRFVAVAVLAFALLVNLATLLQYGLQSARLFKPVAVAAVVPGGVFIVLLVFSGMRTAPDFRVLIALYFVAWIFVLLYLWRQVRPRRVSASRFSWATGKSYILIGWPIVVANVGLGLAQSADRLMVSWAMPIADFARYSFAASTMFVPVAAIGAIARVFFPHIAAAEKRDHHQAYARASRLLVMAWSLMLPYYMVLEVVVRRFLPRYEASLPLAEILLLGIMFLGGIQILHVNFFNLYGLQRRFLIYACTAILVSFGAVAMGAILLKSMWAVAAAESVALALWWFFDEWKLRKITGQGGRDWLRILGLAGWSAVSLLGAVTWIDYPAARVVAYYALVAPFLWFFLSSDLRLCWNLIRA